MVIEGQLVQSDFFAHGTLKYSVNPVTKDTSVDNSISLPQYSWLVGDRMSLLVRFLSTTACICVCGRLLS